MLTKLDWYVQEARGAADCTLRAPALVGVHGILKTWKQMTSSAHRKLLANLPETGAMEEGQGAGQKPQPDKRIACVPLLSSPCHRHPTRPLDRSSRCDEGQQY